MKTIVLFLLISILIVSCIDDSGYGGSPSVIHMGWLRISQDHPKEVGKMLVISIPLESIPAKSRWDLSYFLNGKKIEQRTLGDHVEGDWVIFYKYTPEYAGEHHFMACLSGPSRDFCREIYFTITD